MAPARFRRQTKPSTKPSRGNKKGKAAGFQLSEIKRELAQVTRALSNAKRTARGGRRPAATGSGNAQRAAGGSALDPKLHHFAATVTNPFKADAMSTLAKGIFDPTGTARSLVRVRRVIVPLNLPGSDVAPNGVDIFIPLCTRAPPFVQWARSWDLNTPQLVGPVTGYAGNDTTTELSATSCVRLVAGGVKIGYDGASQNRGGRFYHFPTFDLTSTAFDRASVPNVFGATYSNLKRAISTVEVPNRGDITFILPPRSSFAHVEPTTNPAAPSSTAGGGFANCDGIRLYYNGTGGPYTFEVVAVVEYYDSDDSSACTPTTNHLAGQAIVQNLQNHLTAPLSDNSHVESSGGVAGKFRSLKNIVHEASGALGTVKHFAKEAYDFGMGISQAYGAYTGARAGAAALLTL